MANIISGTNETTGATPSMPSRPAVQLCENTKVTTPNAAPIERRFMITAFSAITVPEGDQQKQERERQDHGDDKRQTTSRSARRGR